MCVWGGVWGGVRFHAVDAVCLEMAVRIMRRFPNIERVRTGASRVSASTFLVAVYLWSVLENKCSLEIAPEGPALLFIAAGSDLS